MDKSCNTLSNEAKEGIIKVFKMWNIIKEPHNQEVTIKFNDGGFLYVRVKKETLFK